MFEKVLLVDDDEDDREFLLEVINEHYPEVVCSIAVNGQDALNQLEVYRPDVIFLDLNMPLMDGRQFLKSINKVDKLADIPVVVVTTGSDKRIQEETISLGAKAFFTKPDKFSGWKDMVKLIFTNP